MTDTERALLRAVCETPWDDEPRLVIADYYEERGQPERAEFIRLQVEYAKWFDPHEQAPRGEPIRTRLNELWSGKNRDGIGYQLDYGPIKSRMDWENCKGENGILIVRRGFPDHVTLTMSQFMGGPCGASADTAHGLSGDCPHCHGTGTIPGLARELFERWPVTRVVISNALIHQSGGNDTYYVGGLVVFPQKYWLTLENYRSRIAAHAALSAAAVAYGRELVGLRAFK